MLLFIIMLRNKSKKWSAQDIRLLSTFVQQGVPLSHICGALGRSERAIQHAIKNILYQQLLDYPVEDVLARYNTSMEYLEENVVPPKYFVPLNNPSSHEEADESSECVEQEKCNGFYQTISKALMMSMTIVVAGGLVKYLQTLESSWCALSLSH